MASRITNIQNVGDGLSVDVTLDSAPSGVLTFKVSRLPGDADAATVTYTSVSATVKRVAVRSVLTHVRLPYYIQAFDGATELKSFQRDADGVPAGETCEWVAKDDNRDWLDLAERAIGDILIDNKQALDRGMQLYLRSQETPKGTLAQVQAIHAGLPSHETGQTYPRVCLRTHSVKDDPYWANPRSDYIPIQTTISCYGCHQGKVNWEPYLRSLGMAVWGVMNTDLYLQVPLISQENPLRLYECYALQGDSEEYFDEQAGVFVARFDIQYQSRLFVGREKA